MIERREQRERLHSLEQTWLTRRQISAICLGLACVGILIKNSSLSWPSVDFLNFILQDICQCLTAETVNRGGGGRSLLKRIKNNRKNHNTHAVFKSSWEVVSLEIRKYGTFLFLFFTYWQRQEAFLGLMEQNEEQMMCIRAPAY